MDGTPGERDEGVGCPLSSLAAAGAQSPPDGHRSAAAEAARTRLSAAAASIAAQRCAAAHRAGEAERCPAGSAEAAGALVGATGSLAPVLAHAIAAGHDPAEPTEGVTAAAHCEVGAAGPEPEGAETDNARHARRMRKRKAARDRMMALKTIEKGLLVVHTGAGKGKSTAALGMVMRCIGHAMPVGIVQFIKGRLATGETAVLERFPDLVTLKRMGEGFTWETQDRARDVAAARAAWEAGQEMIASGVYAMVVLDELNIALRYDYLPLAEVLAGLAARPPGVHVVVTGRNAKEELIAAADLVTEMTMVKHPFRSGVKPQAGIEF